MSRQVPNSKVRSVERFLQASERPDTENSMNASTHVLKFLSAIFGIGLLVAQPKARGADNETSLIEPYLEAGRIAEARKAVETALASDSQNDALRFQLAIAELLGAVEKFGQD